MIITPCGHHCIKLQTGDTTIAVNPVSKDSELENAKFGADVALVSINHPDWSGASDMSFGEKVPFVISGPGEYEVKNTFIKGFLSSSHYDDGEYINTIYSVTMDGIHVCFLGAHGEDKVSDEAVEAMTDIDILFVPVSKDTLSASGAYKIAVNLEAKIIIPLGDEAMIKAFVKEAGSQKPETVDKLTLKKKDLDGKQGEIVLLSA
ncbi:MAG TPA: MBL fold metallo-hydrolase [Candidatus Paceibacterota bacterium]|nr:MBL fold metallo-hydrolase [Candidatus Paceibacterota bacterium]